MTVKDSSIDTAHPTTAQRSTGIWPVLLLVIGDAIVFLIFAAIGRRSHGEASGFAAISQVALTALPFAIGWFLVSPFVGAFRRNVISNPGKMALHTFLSWVGGCVIGMVIRGIFVDHGVPPASFMAVALTSNTIFLLIWRLPFAWIYGHKHR